MARNTVRGRRHPGAAARSIFRAVYPAARRRAQATRGAGPGVAGGAGVASGAGDSGRSPVAAALDQQERAQAGGRTRHTGLSGQRAHGQSVPGGRWTTACTPTAKRVKAARIRTATPGLRISTRAASSSSAGVNRSRRSMRRNMISAPRHSAGRRPTGYTMWPPTGVGAASGWIMIPPSLRSGRCGAGGIRWARDATPSCGIAVSNHPGATRHPALAKAGRFHNGFGSAIAKLFWHRS